LDFEISIDIYHLEIDQIPFNILLTLGDIMYIYMYKGGPRDTKTTNISTVKRYLYWVLAHVRDSHAVSTLPSYSDEHPG